MSANSTITNETVIAGRLRDNGHADGKEWFGTIWQHTTIPRLSAMDKHPRRGRGGTSERVWYVDSVACPSLDEAIARLNVPPVFTDEEREVLGHVPAEWAELHPFRTDLAKRLGREVGTTIMMLRQKGAVENELRPGPERSLPFIRLRVPASALAASEV